MKTIREWFEELEEPYRTQAISNSKKFNPGGLDLQDRSLSDALTSAFLWESTPEGHDYWHSLFLKLISEKTSKNKSHE